MLMLNIQRWKKQNKIGLPSLMGKEATIQMIATSWDTGANGQVCKLECNKEMHLIIIKGISKEAFIEEQVNTFCPVYHWTIWTYYYSNFNTLELWQVTYLGLSFLTFKMKTELCRQGIVGG